MDFQSLMRFAAERGASDIHIQAGLSPKLRIQGILHTVDQPVLTDEQLHQFIASIAPPRLRENLDDRLTAGLDFSYAAPGICRFRCSAYRQLGNAGISMRLIKSKIPTHRATAILPEVINDIALSGRGLTLVTGTTGSGKSTTLAAMIDLINQIAADENHQHRRPGGISAHAQTCADRAVGGGDGHAELRAGAAAVAAAGSRT